MPPPPPPFWDSPEENEEEFADDFEGNLPPPFPFFDPRGRPPMPPPPHNFLPRFPPNPIGIPEEDFDFVEPDSDEFDNFESLDEDDFEGSEFEEEQWGVDKSYSARSRLPYQTGRSENSADSTPRKGYNSLSLIRNEQLEKLRKDGEETAERNRALEGRVKAIKKILIFSGFVFALSLTAISAFFLSIYFNSVQGDSEKNSAEPVLRDGELKKMKDLTWYLSDSKENEVLRSFYSSVGNPQRIAESAYIMQKGTIEIGSKTDSIDFIKKVDGDVFLRVGSTPSERAYLVSLFGGVAQRLFDGTLSGRRADLSTEEDYSVRALIMFDEALFVRAFSQMSRVSLSPISYVGKKEYDGVECNVLKSSDSRGNEVLHCFDAKTKLLHQTRMSNANNSAIIKYSDYSVGDEFYRFPAVREVFLNGKKYATVKIDLVVSNKWMFFPR